MSTNLKLGVLEITVISDIRKFFGRQTADLIQSLGCTQIVTIVVNHCIELISKVYKINYNNLDEVTEKSFECLKYLD